MDTPYSFKVRRDASGRIVEKNETVAGESVTWSYAYDNEGRLIEAKLDGRTVCQCDYDREGRRMRDRLPLTSGNSFRNYSYRMDNRLMQVGDNRYTHDEKGFRSIWSHRGKYTTYQYAPDHRLLEVHQEDEDIRFTFDHDENGQRRIKYRNGEIAEAYKWLDFTRLAGFYDGEHVHEFAYEGEARTPFALRRDDGGVVFLFYDQVGSLRVVADTNGVMIKEILYDPFGMVIKDTNPSLTIPIGFAGGLHDRDIGFVRFGWRDYDPNTARWTAPDPMGDAGGDTDWYGYCLDDPVNGIDPLGLFNFGPGGYNYDGSKRDDNSDKGGEKKGSSDKGNGGWGFSENGRSFPGGLGPSRGAPGRGEGGSRGGRPGSLKNPGERTPQDVRDIKLWEKSRKLTTSEEIRALQLEEKEQARKARIAREAERVDRLRRQRAGLSIAHSALIGASGGFVNGAIAGGALTGGPGAIPGGIVGGVYGGTTGLLSGTLFAASDYFDSDEE